MRCIERPTRQTRRPLASAARMTRVHPRHVGGEAGDGDLALQPADQRDQGRRARRPPSRPRRRRRRWCESQTMASTPSSPRRGWRRWSVTRAQQRVRIDLPVAGVQDRAQRRADRQAVRLGDRVGQRDQLQLERAELDRAAQRHLGDLRLVQQAGLAQLLAQQEGGEGRGVDRRLQPRPQPGDRADVVLVGVGQHDAQDVVGVLLDEGRVGQDDLDARRGLVAEGHAEIDHDPLAVVRRAEAVEVEVHADLVRPAERQEDEFVVAWLGALVI